MRADAKKYRQALTTTQRAKCKHMQANASKRRQTQTKACTPSIRAFLNLWFAKPMVSMRGAFHENDWDHGTTKMTKTTQTTTNKESTAGLAETTETTEMMKTTGVWGANDGYSCTVSRVQGPLVALHVSQQISSESWGFAGVAAVSRYTPPLKGPVALVALELPGVSHVKLPLTRCRATGRCSSYRNTSLRTCFRLIHQIFSQKYHRLGNVDLIYSQLLQIRVGIGKFL